MANDTTITIIGNLTADPELRFTPSGSAVANVTIASTPRTFDKQTSEWKDGEPLFMRAAIWREPAENVAESLTKGMKVVAVGRLKSRSYDHKDGHKVTVMEMELDELAPSLTFARARVERVQRNGQQGAAQNAGNFAGNSQGGYQQGGQSQQGQGAPAGNNGQQGGQGYQQQQQQQQQSGQQYANAAANGPQGGGWNGGASQPGQPAADPWAMPGGQQQQQGNEAPY